AYLGNIPQAIDNQAPAFEPLRPLWSLQIEEQYYLLFPAVVALCSRRQLRAALIGCVLGALALRVGLTLVFGESSRLACYLLMPCRMNSLAIGGLLAIGVRVPGKLALLS